MAQFVQEYCSNLILTNKGLIIQPFSTFVMRNFVLVILLLLSSFLSLPTYAKDCVQTYSKNDYIHISRINLSCKNIELVSTNQKDQGLTVSEFAEKYQSAVAINGSFFRKDGSPIGMNITQYKPWKNARDTRSRSFLACSKDNKCMIDSKNHAAKINPNWQLATAGWHYYDNKSKKFSCAPQDKVGCSQSIFSDKHPRTMLGLDESQNLLYLVVVEGRQLTYRGMTLDELADLATELKLTKAINLDGGGSSVMVVAQKRISDLPLLQGNERKVGNHFGVRVK